MARFRYRNCKQEGLLAAGHDPDFDLLLTIEI
jgi:hypothetical protein